MNINLKDEKTFISLDLGTANVVAYVSGQGIIFNEPALVAYDLSTNSILTLGKGAYEIIGKTASNIRIISPLVEGVIADMEATEDLLKHIFSRLKMAKVWKDSVVLMACPAGVTELEREAIKNVAKDMGAGLVIIEEESKMAAIGAGINIELPEGNLVIDIGGGTTDAAIISAGEIVVSKSIKNAGQHFNEEIRKYIRSEYNVAIGLKTAENIKKEIGSLVKYQNERTVQVFGRDIVSGLPREIKITAEEIRNILLNSFSKITDMLIDLLENTPPELTGDVMRNGITICGGGSLIRNVDKYFLDIFQLPTRLARDPLMCVIEGTKQFEKVVKKRIAAGYYVMDEKSILDKI